MTSSVIPWFSVRDAECPHSEGGMYVRVSSPIVEEGISSRVETRVQDWTVQVVCHEHPEFKNLDGILEMHLESDGNTGTGTLFGVITIKKLVRCDFDFELTFDVTTGRVLSMTGSDVCGQPLYADDIVVPFLR